MKFLIIFSINFLIFKINFIDFNTIPNCLQPSIFSLEKLRSIQKPSQARIAAAIFRAFLRLFNNFVQCSLNNLLPSQRIPFGSFFIDTLAVISSD